MAAKKKVAVVTGGGTGLGRATAKALERDGFTVAVCGRRPEKLKPRGPERFRPYVCDVADRAQVRATVARIVKDLGRIDVLVNNAGVIKRQMIEEITPDAIDYTFAVNVVGTINVALACLPALKKTKGTIINISSTLADRPNPGSAVYAASKGAIDSFSKAMALEVAKHGVRVNVVAPALVRSDIYSSIMDKQALEKFLIERGKTYPLGRAGEPDDVSELVAYLASPHTAWMTGAVIPIDGGKMVA
jgi:NAD(P)-dependent dehydrogenase (short-subunit alcohol dehydrogenase family)